MHVLLARKYKRATSSLQFMFDLKSMKVMVMNQNASKSFWEGVQFHKIENRYF